MKKRSCSLTDSTQSKKETILITTAVLAAVVFLMSLDMYRCPLEHIFGIPCPLCGATRAMMCVLSGRFREAFYYHPLWPVFIIAGILFILYFFGIIKVKQPVRKAALVFMIVLLVGCYIIRHICHSPVVAVHFKESSLYRMLVLLHII